MGLWVNGFMFQDTKLIINFLLAVNLSVNLTGHRAKENKFCVNIALKTGKYNIGIIFVNRKSMKLSCL